jgi:hypothetical protein
MSMLYGLLCHYMFASCHLVAICCNLQPLLIVIHVVQSVPASAKSFFQHFQEACIFKVDVHIYLGRQFITVLLLTKCMVDWLQYKITHNTP